MAPEDWQESGRSCLMRLELVSGWLLALTYIPTLSLWGHISDYAMEKQSAW